MSETKHTPGPWFVTGSMTKYVEARLAGGMVQEVAAVGPTAADSGYGEQQHTNANLIAAAPDLLEALEKLVLHQEALGRHNIIIDEARATIARAKGQ